MRAKRPSTLAELLANSAMLGARMAHISFADWQRAVGPRLAKKAFPERLSDGVLTVRVPSSTWAQELSLLSSVVLERLQGNGHAVQRMRFQVHATPPQPAASPVARVAPVELPAQLRAMLDRIDDPELRRTIADAAAFSLARQR
jgi:hypothetical protein